jgi:hypothetical protein
VARRNIHLCRERISWGYVPSGHYSLTKVLWTDGRLSLQLRKNPDKLVFHKYGDQYFLSEIHGEVGESSGKLSTSALEQRFQREQAAVPNQGRTEIALKK